MNRSVLKTLARLAVACVCLVALTTTNVGCAGKNCGPCATAKGCGKGCTKPCCNKAAPAGDQAKPAGT